MKTAILATVYSIMMAVCAYSQGTFAFINGTAPTRIGSADGPLAGHGIWAQMLVGLDQDSLTPVGISVQHVTNGIASGGTITVPNIPPLTSVYVQMAAWDGNLWGTSLGSVPQEWLGRTDIVTVRLADPIQPPPTPFFRQPAIVPVTEPSVLALAVLGGAVLAFRPCTGQRRP